MLVSLNHYYLLEYTLTWDKQDHGKRRKTDGANWMKQGIAGVPNRANCRFGEKDKMPTSCPGVIGRVYSLQYIPHCQLDKISLIAT